MPERDPTLNCDLASQGVQSLNSFRIKVEYDFLGTGSYFISESSAALDSDSDFNSFEPASSGFSTVALALTI